MLDQPSLNRKPVALVGDLRTPTGVASVWNVFYTQPETSSFYAPDRMLSVCNPGWLGDALRVHGVTIGLINNFQPYARVRCVPGADLALDG